MKLKERPAKVQKLDTRAIVDMKKLDQGTVVALLSNFTEATERLTRTLERFENLLVDNTVVQSKNADSTTRLRWAIERYEKKSRQEYDRKLSEERRRKMERLRRQSEKWGDMEWRLTDRRKKQFDSSSSIILIIVNVNI